MASLRKIEQTNTDMICGTERNYQMCKKTKVKLGKSGKGKSPSQKTATIKSRFKVHNQHLIFHLIGYRVSNWFGNNYNYGMK